jgi:hypothetical protein
MRVKLALIHSAESRSARCAASTVEISLPLSGTVRSAF